MSSDGFEESPGDVKIWFGKDVGLTMNDLPPDDIDWYIHPDQKSHTWFDPFRSLVEAYRSSPEYPDDVKVWFGSKQKGTPIRELPRYFIDWCTLPERKNNCKWFDQFKGLIELYDSKREPECPGEVKVWFGRFKRTPIREVPRWYIDYATHPAQDHFRWHQQFKRLFEAYRRTLPEVKPGSELLWFGVRKYRGKALNEVYSMDKKYILWCANPKRESSTWYPEFMRILNNYLEKRKKRPYRPRARTEIIRDIGDKCGPWDDDDQLTDDEYDTTDGFIKRDPDADREPDEWEEYEEPEAQGYKEEPGRQGDGVDGEEEEEEAEEDGVDGEEKEGEDESEDEEQAEEGEAHFTDGNEEATSSLYEETESDQDLAWSDASPSDIVDGDSKATSESEEYVQVSTPRKRTRAKKMLVESESEEASDEALPSPSRLFASDLEDDVKNTTSSEEEMATTPRTPKRRAVKQVVVSSDDESDALESCQLGNRFLSSPGSEPPVTPMVKGNLKTPSPTRRYPKRTRKQTSRYANQRLSQDEGSEGDDEALAPRTPFKRRKTIVSGRAH